MSDIVNNMKNKLHNKERKHLKIRKISSKNMLTILTVIC